MDPFVFIDELIKSAADATKRISDADAEKAYDQLQSLERSRPTGGQVARYAALGATAAPVIGAVKDVIQGKTPFGLVRGARLSGQVKPMLRDIAGSATAGALSSGAVPLVRGHLDRQAHIGTLKSYINQYEHPSPKPPASPTVPVGTLAPASMQGGNDNA